jgi:hypothetical protein
MERQDIMTTFASTAVSPTSGSAALASAGSASPGFASIDHDALVTVSGGAADVAGKVTLPTGASAEGSVKVTPNPVKQYGTSELLACKQQAADNFGGIFQSSQRLDAQLADCDRQFGKQ